MDRLDVDKRRAYGLIIAATVSYTLLTFIWFSLPAFLSTIITEVGLTNTQAGVLVGAVPLTYIPFALFSGLAVDKIGPGRVIALGVIAYGIGQVGRSAAPEFLSLLAFTLLIGVGATTITFGLPKLVSVLFPPKKTGRPSAIYLVGSSAGSAIVFAIGRPVLGPLFGGWRPLFFWSGLLAIGYGLVWLLVATRVDIDGVTENGSSVSVSTLGSDLRLVLTHPELQLVVIIGTMYLLLNHGIQGWLPTILESRGLSAGLAGQMTSLFVISIIVGIVTIPELADRFDVRYLALIGCGMLTIFGVVNLIQGQTSSLTVTGIVAIGIGTGGISPLIRVIPPDLDGIGPQLTGTAVGFIFAVGEIGGFAGPVLIGTLHDVSGSFIPGLAVLAMGGLVVVLTADRLRRLTECAATDIEDSL